MRLSISLVCFSAYKPQADSEELFRKKMLQAHQLSSNDSDFWPLRPHQNVLIKELLKRCIGRTNATASLSHPVITQTQNRYFMSKKLAGLGETAKSVVTRL